MDRVSSLPNGVSPGDLRRSIADLSSRLWGLSALGVVLERQMLLPPEAEKRPEELAEQAGAPLDAVRRLLDVLVALDLVERVDGAYRLEPGLAAVAADEHLRAEVRSMLLQAADLFAAALRPEPIALGWSVTDPAVLEAQGTMSAGAVDILQRVVFPSIHGLDERLRRNGAAFLDAGSGVAALTIEMCRRYPAMRAVGLEPQDAPLQLARRNVARARLDDRVELRQALVEDLDDEAAYDVVWLPVDFIPPHALAAALPRVLRALRPGGTVLLTTLGGGGDDLPSAAARLCATLWGGDAVEPEELHGMLARAGFVDVVELPRLPSSQMPMHARRPSDAA